GKVSRLFGVYDESTGLDLRGTFIINPEGKLLNMEMNFYNLGRNIDEMMRKFKANIYMSKKTNEVCPSKWKDEGDKTLVAPGAKRGGKGPGALNTWPSARRRPHALRVRRGRRRVPCPLSWHVTPLQGRHLRNGCPGGRTHAPMGRLNSWRVAVSWQV